jgi:NADPH:quinone reductase-like Zn-dependent oxidoreductase/enamine deaminase RidA (YjgF/YER057c/UK114 family)
VGMAAVIYKKGAPDNFVWEEIKVGSPERGQVRLRSTAVGVNFADTYHRAGIPHPMIVGDPPVVLGFEGVSEIEELGPGVTGFSVGERVCTCLPPLGAYSQERLYPADKLIKVPKDLPLDDVQLAGLILKGMTAQYLLHRTHKVQPGDYVLIHAAAGGMGHILCPWARHLGATVIGTVSTDAKAEIARNLGCHHVINYSTEDFVAVTRKITDGKGVDVVYESIGKDTLQKSLDCLRLVGMCAAYGQASGVPDPIDIVKDLGVRGSLIITRPALSHYISNRNEIDAGAKSLFDAVAQGVVASNVVKTFPLREAAAAQVHRRTQDNGLDRHASIRVSGPKKAGETPSATLVMTSRPPPEALGPQKGNIMSILRHEIRKISDENRGQPIISQAVVHGNVAYFAGITPNPIVGDIKTQTAQVLRRVDELLNLAGTDKSHLLSAQVWIADMRLFEDHNSVWNEWVDPANPPTRACLTTDFWRPGMLVEVMVVAAVP